MFQPGELKSSLSASWALFRGDESAINRFDLSIAGFWRSFFVLLPLLPLYFVNSLAEKKLVLAEGRVPLEAFPENHFWITQFVSLGLDWIAFPLVLALLAGPLGLSAGYVRFVILRNWTSLLCAVPFVLAAALHLMDIIPEGTFILMSIITVAVILHFRYRITRLAFGAPVSVAMGLVAFDFLLSILIGALVVRA